MSYRKRLESLTRYREDDTWAAQGKRLGADEAKAIVRRRFDELDVGNIGILDELFSPDYKLNFPGQEPFDLQETRRFYQQMYAAFSGLRHEIRDQIAEGEKVVTRWTATGRHTGQFLGTEPMNQVVSFDGINIYTFDGDKLVESHVTWDLGGLDVARAKTKAAPTTNTELSALEAATHALPRMASPREVPGGSVQPSGQVPAQVKRAVRRRLDRMEA